MYYKTTALEDYINQRYFRLRLKEPRDININRIAWFYSIYIHHREMPARYDIFGKYKAIVLDSRCTKEEQREQFFHEFCHILRHVGHQSMLPKAFRELQEWDAQLFTMYAALPYYMVREYDFEDPNIIYNLSMDFKVTEELCIRRLEQIKRNYITYSFIARQSKARYTKA